MEIAKRFTKRKLASKPAPLRMRDLNRVMGGHNTQEAQPDQVSRHTAPPNAHHHTNLGRVMTIKIGQATISGCKASTSSDTSTEASTNKMTQPSIQPHRPRRRFQSFYSSTTSSSPSDDEDPGATIFQPKHASLTVPSTTTQTSNLSTLPPASLPPPA